MLQNDLYMIIYNVEIMQTYVTQFIEVAEQILGLGVH